MSESIWMIESDGKALSVDKTLVPFTNPMAIKFKTKLDAQHYANVNNIIDYELTEHIFEDNQSTLFEEFTESLSKAGIMFLASGHKNIEATEIICGLIEKRISEAITKLLEDIKPAEWGL